MRNREIVVFFYLVYVYLRERERENQLSVSVLHVMGKISNILILIFNFPS